MRGATTVPPAPVTYTCRSIRFFSLRNSTNVKRVTSIDTIESAPESWGRSNVVILNLACSHICNGSAMMMKYVRSKLAFLRLARVACRHFWILRAKLWSPRPNKRGISAKICKSVGFISPDNNWIAFDVLDLWWLSERS